MEEQAKYDVLSQLKQDAEKRMNMICPYCETDTIFRSRRTGQVWCTKCGQIWENEDVRHIVGCLMEVVRTFKGYVRKMKKDEGKAAGDAQGNDDKKQ